MRLRCRSITPEDFGTIVRGHWSSRDEVREGIERQGIGSMLAFDADRCVGQLYAREYDPDHRSPGGWTGDWPWADFTIAEPLALEGRYLTLGCYHVGEFLDGGRDPSVQEQGVGKSLLSAMIDWCRGQEQIDGLLAWGLVPGSWQLLQWAGQMPHTVYRKFGFDGVKSVRDPRLDQELADVDTSAALEDPALLRVMLRVKGQADTRRRVSSEGSGSSIVRSGERLG